MKKSLDKESFDFRYKLRDNDLMMNGLGYSIASVAQHSPGGMLIFFPSYALMDRVYHLWEESGVLDKITESKVIMLEPRKA